MASTVQVGELPLLAAVPAEVRAVVERAFRPVELEFGDRVFTYGEEPDGYYLVVEGTARVFVHGDDGQEVSLNVLGPGDTFGEGALLDGTSRSASVRASSPLTVLRLDAGLFRALVERYPEIAAEFDAAAQARRVNDFLRVHSAFAVLPREATLELIADLETVSLVDGQIAVHEGEPADAMYLIAGGRLGVWVGDRRVRTLHAGEFFGELALLRASPRTATVRAEGPVSLLRLSDARFRRLMVEQPRFAERINERVKLYDARDRRSSVVSPTISDREVWRADDPGLAVGDDGATGRSEDGPLPRPRRVRLVRQIDEMDCGAACVAMICRAFGHDVSMTAIRQAVGTGTDGTSLRGLVRGGEEIGLQMRAIKSSPDRLDTLPTPAIVHWGGNHWVVLERVEPERVRIADPGRGLRKVPRDEMAKQWSGYVALPTPTDRLAAAPRGGFDLRWMWPFVRPHRRALVLALGLALVAAGFEMILPIFSQRIIDDVIGGEDRTLLYVLFAGMLGVITLAAIVTIGQRFLMARMAARLDADTLDFMSARLLSLPMRYFESRRTGDIERRLSGLQQIRLVLIQSGVAAATAFAQLLVAVVIMLSYSLPLGLLYLASAPLYAGLMRFSSRRMRPMFDAVEIGHGRYQSRQIDAIRGIATVKTMGAEEGLRRRMRSEFAELRDRLFQADLVAMVYEGMTSVVTYLVYALFLFLAALEVLNHNLTVGGLVAFNGLVLLANGPLLILLATWDRLQLVTVLLGRLQDVIDQEPEQPAADVALAALDPELGMIRLRRVGFAYPGNDATPVLTDISLDVPAGSTVALVGRSGSGKSTLARCLAGLILPTTGRIEYDGMELRELDLGELRRRVGFVLQEPYVFDDTILANIAFGEDHPDEEQVRRAAELADAAEFIERLPLGYETRIGDSGMKLSGGQAQRVAIARALYRVPSVLIFDEATSALDTEAERAVKQNLDRLLQGRTAVVIAHRLSTIRDADLICVLDQGRLVERGTHEELVSRQGLYAYLVAQQLEG